MTDEPGYLPGRGTCRELVGGLFANNGPVEGNSLSRGKSKRRNNGIPLSGTAFWVNERS